MRFTMWTSAELSCATSMLRNTWSSKEKVVESSVSAPTLKSVFSHESEWHSKTGASSAAGKKGENITPVRFWYAAASHRRVSGVSNLVAYSMSKFAVRGLTQATCSLILLTRSLWRTSCSHTCPSRGTTQIWHYRQCICARHHPHPSQ